jgi:hypothetical protein
MNGMPHNSPEDGITFKIGNAHKKDTIVTWNWTKARERKESSLSIAGNESPRKEIMRKRETTGRVIHVWEQTT